MGKANLIKDTAGEEKYHAIAPLYYKDADGIIFVFDLTNQESFLSLEKLYRQVSETVMPGTKIILCGNKCDLNQIISIDDAKKY
jgi:small GTP-binding protein